ncbi:MAG TPA: Hsp20/alpha crystallin family protein [Pseudonocardiaceae bacterium]|jgi:HSP20 family protein|nr:Hsp20/alpha crystallin family protein [Pseudonocardiaceae bacterium]
MAVAVRGSTWSPFTTLFRQFDAALVPTYAARPVAFTPAADVTKDGNDVVVTLALPGVDVEKDVEVVVTEGKLAISGKRAEQTESTTNGVLRREIHSGEFRREFTIPRDVTADRVEADYDKGLLKVRVREVVRQTPEPAKVQIRSAAAVAAVEAETR